ncbi:MAG: hypothetical protein V2A74_03045, partial [bacterium]
PPLDFIPQSPGFDSISRRAQLLETVGQSDLVWLLLYKPDEKDLEDLLLDTMPGWETQKVFRLEVAEVWLLLRPQDNSVILQHKRFNN